ncbi:MAG: hypothetical protein ACNA8W_02355 [Bradymonadaceae bacterium]
MTELFGRQIIIEIGEPGGEARRWTELRISGRVEKSPARSPNTCIIEVYNPSPVAIALAQVRGVVVRVLAGHSVPRLLFTGTVNKGGAVLAKQGVDRVLTIEATDGGRRFQEAHVNQTFSRELTAEQVFGILADAMGLPLGAVQVGEDVRFSGVSVVGPVRDALDDLVRSIGARWSVQDGALQVLTDDEDTGEAVVVVSAKSGNLIGSPSPTDDGIEFTALLDGRIRPGRRVILESEQYKGTYRAREVQHVFDSGWEDSFYTVVTGRAA